MTNESGIKLELLRHGQLPDPIALGCTLWRTLSRKTPRPTSGRAEWTRQVANAVADLCPDGLYVYGQQWSKDERAEYLVDQCWRQRYQNIDETHYLPGAIMFAMECEWLVNPLGQMHDFQKLLDLRAEKALYVARLSKWSKEHDAIVACILLAKWHAKFFGEIVIYFFDHNNPKDNFRMWRIERKQGSAEIDGPNDIGNFIKSGGCESLLR